MRNHSSLVLGAGAMWVKGGEAVNRPGDISPGDEAEVLVTRDSHGNHGTLAFSLGNSPLLLIVMWTSGINCDHCLDAPTACGYMKEISHDEPPLDNQSSNKELLDDDESPLDFPEAQFLSDIHHLREVTSNPRPEDLNDEEYKMETISSFFCTTESCVT